MAWCRYATHRYLSQYWPRFMLSYGVTTPRWVKGYLKVVAYLHQLSWIWSFVLFLVRIAPLKPKSRHMPTFSLLSATEVNTTTNDDKVSTISMLSTSSHDANFVVTGGIGVCHNENIQQHQLRQRWHLPTQSVFSVNFPTKNAIASENDENTDCLLNITFMCLPSSAAVAPAKCEYDATDPTDMFAVTKMSLRHRAIILTQCWL